MEVKLPGVNFNHQILMEGILNTKTYIEAVNKQLYDKVLNLASDPKEHFNIGLHITQNQDERERVMMEREMI